MADIWRACGSYMEGMWLIYGGYGAHIWRVRGSYMEGTGLIYGGYGAQIWRVQGSYMYMEGAGRVCGSYTIVCSSTCSPMWVSIDSK